MKCVVIHYISQIICDLFCSYVGRGFELKNFYCIFFNICSQRCIATHKIQVCVFEIHITCNEIGHFGRQASLNSWDPYMINFFESFANFQGFLGV